MWFFWFIIALWLIIFLIALPVWPHSRRWSYYPGGGLILLLIIFLLIWWLVWLPYAAW
jgi:hypothetical protein